VDALGMKDEKIVFDAGRCIGCGLCVTVCPAGALHLDKKPEDSLYQPPETVFDAFAAMSKEKAAKKGDGSI